MMQDDDDDDDDDDNDDPMILNNRAKNHTSERTIVPWTVIFVVVLLCVPPASFPVKNCSRKYDRHLPITRACVKCASFPPNYFLGILQMARARQIRVHLTEAFPQFKTQFDCRLNDMVL